MKFSCFSCSNVKLSSAFFSGFTVVGMGLVLGLGLPTPVNAQFYTDFAPSGPGFGGNGDFLWNTNLTPFWNTDATGNAGAVLWTNTSPGNDAVLGPGAGTATYTALLFNNVTVGVISTVNGTWGIGLASNTLTLDSSINYSLGVPIIGAGNVVKNGATTITVGTVNDYIGGTSINAGILHFTNTNTNVGPVSVNSGGTLQLGSSSALPATTALTLAGGTLALSGAHSPTFSTPLSLTASSTLDFGSGFGTSAFVFGDSSGQTWTGTLTIANYNNSTTDSLRFGTNANGLTGAQLSAINFGGFAAQIDSSGFVTAVPEPATYAAIFGIGVLAFATYHRRKGRVTSIKGVA